jgi:hypothetical protein
MIEILITILFLGVCVILHLRYKKGYKWKDIFSPKKWKAVYIYWLKKHLKWLDPQPILLTSNEMLQIAYRVANCTDCVYEGRCVDCKCPIDGKISDKNQECSLNKWGPMLNDKEMEIFKKNYNISFTVKTEKK